MFYCQVSPTASEKKLALIIMAFLVFQGMRGRKPAEILALMMYSCVLKAYCIFTAFLYIYSAWDLMIFFNYLKLRSFINFRRL